ncbi:hypothetical protein [Lichenihabitans psoromatis]|uniref:hypothetical protein n=1 Tax=Lichenihabitans psoromatis TaxID=2528642 RepID=UPI0010383B8C|nr:hypothetical protein [Lichenihabitans psoromatis]
MIAREILAQAAATASVAILLAVLGASAARAQAYENPNLPRSPYALPVPQFNGSVDEPDGEDAAHPQGSWRHWGDTRNEGQVFQQLFAPGGVAGGAPGYAYGPEGLLPPPVIEDPRRVRFCRRHPDRCAE